MFLVLDNVRHPYFQPSCSLKFHTEYPNMSGILILFKKESVFYIVSKACSIVKHTMTHYVSLIKTNQTDISKGLLGFVHIFVRFMLLSRRDCLVSRTLLLSAETQISHQSTSTLRQFRHHKVFIISI